MVSVVTSVRPAKRLESETSRGKLTKGQNVHKSVTVIVIVICYYFVIVNVNNTG